MYVETKNIKLFYKILLTSYRYFYIKSLIFLPGSYRYRGNTYATNSNILSTVPQWIEIWQISFLTFSYVKFVYYVSTYSKIKKIWDGHRSTLPEFRWNDPYGRHFESRKFTLHNGWILVQHVYLISTPSK